MYRRRGRGRRGRRRLLLAGACSVALSSVVAFGGALAYFSDAETVENRFSVADPLEVSVVEPGWSLEDGDGDGVPDAGQGIVPRQVVPKDPRIENRAGTSCWMAAQVRVPLVQASVTGEDGLATEARATPLFSWALLDGWSELGDPFATDDGTALVHTYLADKPVEVGGQTPPIFSEVRLADLVEGSFSGPSSIEVRGIGVQTLGFASPEEAWEAYNASTTGREAS